MKQFENKVLFIKDEPMLKEVEKLILEAGFYVYKKMWFLMSNSTNYLFHRKENVFSMSFKMDKDEEITLEQFKELLKQK